MVKHIKTADRTRILKCGDNAIDYFAIVLLLFTSVGCRFFYFQICFCFYAINLIWSQCFWYIIFKTCIMHLQIGMHKLTNKNKHSYSGCYVSAIALGAFM